MHAHERTVLHRRAQKHARRGVVGGMRKAARGTAALPPCHLLEHVLQLLNGGRGPLSHRLAALCATVHLLPRHHVAPPLNHLLEHILQLLDCSAGPVAHRLAAPAGAAGLVAHAPDRAKGRIQRSQMGGCTQALIEHAGVSHRG